MQGKESIAFALTGLPPLGELFVMVLQELRVPVHTLRNMSPAEQQTAFHTSFFPLCRAIHFLRQDQHANALFKWHDDLNDLKGLRPAVSEQMVTAIVQLNDGDTAMRLYDFEPHKFSQAGNCVLFNGAAVHESVPLKDPGGSRASSFGWMRLQNSSSNSIVLRRVSTRGARGARVAHEV